MRNTAEQAKWQYEVMSDHHVFARKYRFNVDEARTTFAAKIDAEYYNEDLKQWRKTRSETTKKHLYDIHLAALATGKPSAGEAA